MSLRPSISDCPEGRNKELCFREKLTKYGFQLSDLIHGKTVTCDCIGSEVFVGCACERIVCI